MRFPAQIKKTSDLQMRDEKGLNFGHSFKHEHYSTLKMTCKSHFNAIKGIFSAMFCILIFPEEKTDPACSDSLWKYIPRECCLVPEPLPVVSGNRFWERCWQYGGGGFQ